MVRMVAIARVTALFHCRPCWAIGSREESSASCLFTYAIFTANFLFENQLHGILYPGNRKLAHFIFTYVDPCFFIIQSVFQYR